GRNKRVRCEIAEVRGLGSTGVPVVLGVPMTYMNLSGDPVQSAAAWFKVPPDRTIVIHDDLDVPVGGLKLKRGGGHAGHNGLKDVDRALGTREYVRVRIGVGRPPGRMPGKDHVLRRPSPADREQLDVVIEEAADAVALTIADGLESAQNRYHAR
ncbi:MAG: aminoacyl-tRNA hydrolase, partial [Nitriliruptor sp.]